MRCIQVNLSIIHKRKLLLDLLISCYLPWHQQEWIQCLYSEKEPLIQAKISVGRLLFPLIPSIIISFFTSGFMYKMS